MSIFLSLRVGPALKDEGKLLKNQFEKSDTQKVCLQKFAFEGPTTFSCGTCSLKGLIFWVTFYIFFKQLLVKVWNFFFIIFFLQTLSFGNASSSKSKQGIWYKSDSTGSVCLPHSSTDGEKDWWTDSRWHTAEQEV